MPKFKVRVKFEPEPVEYEVEVDERNEQNAETAAAKLLYSETSFEGADDGSWYFETEQTTELCNECNDEYPVDQIKDGLCPTCYASADTALNE